MREGLQIIVNNDLVPADVPVLTLAADNSPEILTTEERTIADELVKMVVQYVENLNWADKLFPK